MNQSFDVQLQVSLRALNEVVAPVLAQANADKHVVEQLGLVIATLSFLRARLPEARRFARAELRTYLGLAIRAEELSEGATGLEDCVALANATLREPEVDLQDIEDVSRILRSRVTLSHCQAAGKPFFESLEAAILSISGNHVDQCRRWCEPFGFEARPETLPVPAW